MQVHTKCLLQTLLVLGGLFIIVSSQIMMRKKNKFNIKNNIMLTALHHHLRVKFQLDLLTQNKNGKWKDYRNLRFVKIENLYLLIELAIE